MQPEAAPPEAAPAGGGRGGQRRGLIRIIGLILLTAAVTFGITAYAYRGQVTADATLAALEAQPSFPRFLQAITLTREHYVTKPDLNTMVEGAISGAIASLHDPYSTYFSASAYKSFNIETSGEYGGIGIEVQDQSNQIVIFRTFPGTPAADTPYDGAPASAPHGLQPGDILAKVGGKAIAGMPLQSVSNLIRGKPGTVVAITVDRTVDGKSEPLTFHLKRATIVVPTAEGWMMPNKIGYLNINQFAETTPNQVGAVLATLRADGMKGLILDLRNNPGGLVNAALGVASQMMPNGVLTYLINRQGQRTNYTITNGHKLAVPMVVLVNQYSASAAEILSGAIQDGKVAPLIGTQTFGKGIVQQIFPMQGHTGLKITTAHYYTPKGRDINKKGLTPDVVVPLPKSVAPGIIGDRSKDTPTKDPQLARAIAVLQGEMAGK